MSDIRLYPSAENIKDIILRPAIPPTGYWTLTINSVPIEDINFTLEKVS